MNDYFDPEQLAKVTGTISTVATNQAITSTPEFSGLTIGNGVQITIPATPALPTFARREFVLLVSKVTDMATDGTSAVVVTDGTNIMQMVDDKGYFVRADRLAAKARFIGADAILPIRCVLASDPQRVVVLSFLPPTAAGNTNGGAAPMTTSSSSTSSSSTSTGTGTGTTT